VSKRYGEAYALSGVSFSIRRGDITGVIGRSGAGKTTLLRILAGLELPTEGQLFFEGEIITNRNAVKLRKAATMLFQTPLFLRGDVYTNVSYGLTIRRAPKEEMDKKIRAALTEVKLEGFEKKIARSLSGGEQQRVAFARALANDPPILLVDEPTANLDETTGTEIVNILSSLKESGKTIVVTTHDARIVHLADRIFHMAKGKIED